MIHEYPNEWEGLPKEQVIDWLDNPCTRRMRKEIERGVFEYDQLAVELVNSRIALPDVELRSKSDQIRVGKLALKQAAGLFETAEAYVKESVDVKA